VLRTLPQHALTPKLAERFASALIENGRYRNAREVSQVATGDARELLLARIERRLGDYGPALARLEGMAARSFDAEVLRADLLYLESRYDEMRMALATCTPATDDERTRLLYLRVLLASETGETIEDQLPSEHYLAARLATYLAASRNDLEAAARHARDSIERARSVAERIDAALDRVYILFTAGEWPEARDEAMRALTLDESFSSSRISLPMRDCGHTLHSACTACGISSAAPATRGAFASSIFWPPISNSRVAALERQPASLRPSWRRMSQRKCAKPRR